MKNKTFSTKKIAGTGVLTALAFIVSFLEFPIFPTADFLKLDFSSVFLLLAGFMYGPILGTISIAVKEGLSVLKSSTGGIGELANFLITFGFIILPTLIYHYKKGIKTVIITLVAGCLIQNVTALIVNRFINFPLYMSSSAKEVFELLWWYIVLFNIIKTVSVSLIVIFLYKRLSYLFKKIHLQEDNVKSSEGNFLSSSEKQTQEIAYNYASTLTNGDVILLEGELGAGKTAFVKGVAKYFGLSGVVSPTYAYLNVYGDFIYHYDCYRLSCGEDAVRLGLTDYFNKDNICIIEWAENIEDVLPQNCKKVKIEKTGKNKRKISL